MIDWRSVSEFVRMLWDAALDAGIEYFLKEW